MEIYFENIPIELKNINQWVLWKLEKTKNGKLTKIPYQVKSYKANTTDSKTWDSFENVVRTYHQGGFNGVGFVFSANDEYCGIDFDKVSEGNGVISDIKRWIDKFNSYTEYSQSGKGIHIIVKGRLNGLEGRKKGNFEIYDKERYFAFTGNLFDKRLTSIQERQSIIEEFHAAIFNGKIQANPKIISVPTKINLSVAEIIERAGKAKNGFKFLTLFNGNHSDYPSQSEADLALCNLIAFYTQDVSQIDRIFRQSKLYRDKWDERHGTDTYGNMTIEKALKNLSSTYQSKNSKAYISEKKDLTSLATSDAGNARALVLLFGEQLRYDHQRKKWFIWNNHYWKVDQDGEIERFALRMQKERLKAAIRITNKDQRNAQISWSQKSDSRQKVNNAIEMAKSMIPIASTIDKFDYNPMLLGCKNGVIDLKAGDFRDGNPVDMISLNTNIDYDVQAQCPRWKQFLDEIFQDNFELIDFIKKAVGYSLTGLTESQCLFILYGTGSNGKTVFIEVISKLLGDYAFTASFQTFESSKYDSQKIRNDIAALKSKRLVTASEVKERSKLNEARIKSLTGGDTLNARFLYGEEFNFIPTHKIWLSVNHKPNVSDMSYAFWRRIRLIPFERTFKKEEADQKLIYKLNKELPGILKWAIEGCLQWQMEGLEPPQKIEDATKKYKSEVDIINQFIEDKTISKSDASVLSLDLYNSYKQWCEENGERSCSNNMFGRKMTELGFQRDDDTKSRKKIYLGIGLLSNRNETN